MFQKWESVLPDVGFNPQGTPSRWLNSTDKYYLLPVSRTAGCLPLAQVIEPKCFFLRKSFKVKKIYFCPNLETHSLCDVCYSLNYTILKMLALHLTMCLWNHLICFGSTLLVCSESESWQRNGSQSPSPNDLEFATPSLCVCGWVGGLWGGTVCLPTYCLWDSSGNWVRQMFTFNILGRKREGTRWWMTRYLYWLTKSVCWSCSCSNPCGARRGPWASLEREDQEVWGESRVNTFWSPSSLLSSALWSSCQSPAELCGLFEADRNMAATNPRVVSWEQLIRPPESRRWQATPGRLWGCVYFLG